MRAKENGKVREDSLPVVNSNTADYVSSAVKALVGAVPFIGSLLVEIAGTIIPNQRIERVTKYAKQLDERLSALDQDFVRSKLTDENFTDLMEEGIRQAARSLTDERREYIASVIATGLSSEDVEFQESKHLLRILGELNDVEVLTLRFYLESALSVDNEFRKKNESILYTQYVPNGAPQQVVDKATLHGSYRAHLASLGLLETRYKVDRQTGVPAFSKVSRTFDKSGYYITRLGRLLLAHIGLNAKNRL